MHSVYLFGNLLLENSGLHDDVDEDDDDDVDDDDDNDNDDDNYDDFMMIL